MCDGITDRIRIVGVSGGIGSGKSVVCRILSLRGFQVYDCDSRARELMHTPAIASELRRIVGDKVFDLSGQLDRRFLAEKIFSDTAILREVNRVVHTAVLKDVAFCASRNDGRPLFVESAIPATSGLTALTDIVWVVDAPMKVRIDRVRLRNPELTVEDILSRIEAQQAECSLPEDKRVRIIDNSGNVALLPQMENLLSELTMN